MLIVILLLAVLAVIIIPMISTSSEDAKLNTLKTNLARMRKAIEIYHYQHGNTYPGVKRALNGGDVTNQGQAATSFSRQLTKYSEVTGNVAVIKTAAAKYGPYITGGEMPTNPFNDMDAVICDITTTDITVRTSDGTSGWKFYTQTGILMANDGAHDGL